MWNVQQDRSAPNVRKIVDLIRIKQHVNNAHYLSLIVYLVQIIKHVLVAFLLFCILKVLHAFYVTKNSIIVFNVLHHKNAKDANLIFTITIKVNAAYVQTL